MKRFLRQVTVTGADDSIPPESLSGIQQAYPYAEFGILCSKNSESNPRFPSHKWIDDLARLNRYPLHLSMHLCGTWVRSLCIGDELMFTDWISEYFRMFSRIQLNFHGQPHRIGSGYRFIGALAGFHDLPIIFQQDGENNHLFRFALENSINAYPLEDLSGGAGVLPEIWAKPIPPYSGYAGGLSPDNLKDNLGKLSDIVGDVPIWIDAETHLRSNNDKVFDIDKVIRFLEIAKPFVI